ncbi:MAG TPA: M36 family metallopeptidase [Parafilimonas sp.]|nr:M36 family metallopeptidase [Parafilimonas sp.]
MNRKALPLKLTAVCFIMLIVSANGLFAQQLTTQTAIGLIKKNTAVISLTKTDLQNVRISSAYTDDVAGITLVYAQQTYKGIDVFNSIQTYAFKHDKLVAVAGNRIKNIDKIVNTKTGTAGLTPANAVNAAAAHLMLPAPASPSPLRQVSETGKFDFGDLNISSVPVKSQLIWLLNETGTGASLAWQVEIQPKGVADYWLVNVDASQGTVINKINLNLNCKWGDPRMVQNAANDFTTKDMEDDSPEEAAAIGSSKYKVISFPAESPNHPGGAPAFHTNPWGLAGANNRATTLKWNSNGTTDFDSTRGNNVLAQEDANGNNGLGMGAHSSQPLPDLVFNYNPKLDKQPTIPVNRNFAITNLFYWNNIMHDIAYQYGFNEKSGNFQANNLGRGGAGNDLVFADAQDGSSTNNANFSTPPDGTSPRMQMFLWDAVPNLMVTRPDNFAGRKTSTESAFSSNNKIEDKGPIAGRVVLYDDNAGGTSHLGCNAASNAAELNGKIALIDRGTCGFTIKVKNAQNAGAIGAIVVDNIPGEYPIIMGGTDNSITTPAVMVSFETGDTMKQKLDAGTNLAIKMTKGVKLDGDLDNGIIAHEYTHGISNRLTGGPNNVTCLQNREEMGEGWSDYMALMVTTDWAAATLKDSSKSRTLGTYAFGQQPDGPGIRFYPYSTKLSVNPWTYDSLKLSSRFSNNILQYDPHVVGEVWCNMLWNLTWAITKQTGTINKNIYNARGNGGNNTALALVMVGLRLQPCSPGFVDGRNAILKADTLLYGGANSATIWKVFASRGLGYNAKQGSSDNLKDGVADYSLPPSNIAIAQTTQDAVAGNKGLVTVAPNPANRKVTLTISGNKKLLTVDLVNTTGQQLKRFNMRGEMLNINLPKLASGMYYLRITGEGFAATRQLIIQ